MSLISSNYVEDVDLGEVMDGALRGLTEGLDADSAYLSAADADRIESGRPLPAGGIGVEVRRRYYLQVVAPRDGSPAAQAGVLPGDFIRAIDREPTRFMSRIEGQRLLRGEPGFDGDHLAHPRQHAGALRHRAGAGELSPIAGVTHRMMRPKGIGYVRVALLRARGRRDADRRRLSGCSSTASDPSRVDPGRAQQRVPAPVRARALERGAPCSSADGTLAVPPGTRTTSERLSKLGSSHPTTQERSTRRNANESRLRLVPRRGARGLPDRLRG